jgi:hypothetical protein
MGEMARLIGLVTESGWSDEDQQKGEKPAGSNGADRRFFNFSIETVRLMVPEHMRDRVPAVGTEVNAVFVSRFPRGGGRPYLMLTDVERAQRYAG